MSSKSWRIWLVLLLAVLLPVRGAVAGAMLCEAAGASTMAVTGADAHAGHHHEAAAPTDAQGSHDHAASDRCNMCAAYCSLTPLASQAPAVAEPVGLSDPGFREPAAPPPSFLSDGQERPPRTT